MGGKIPKQYIRLEGVSILGRTLAAVLDSELVDAVIAVVPEEDLRRCREQVIVSLNTADRVKLAAGGPDRQQSVYLGLKACPEDTGIVVVHDGVRPFITPGMIRDCIDTAERWGGAITGIAAVDTLKAVDEKSRILSTIDREPVRLAQTPQAFRFSLLLEAHERALKDGCFGTDDAQLVERIGGDVRVVEGSPRNIKITRPDDLVVAEAFLKNPAVP